MKRIQAAVLAVCGAVLVVLLYTGREAAANPATDVSDLEQIRGMGNAFTLYHKKYRTYPALMNPAKATEIGEVRKKGNCLALKLLLAGGFLEDAKALFSPRNGTIDPDTLAAITKEMDPAKDTTFACAYAYDAGHNQLHGATLFFGSENTWLKTHDDDNAHVIGCNGTVKSIERKEDSKKFLVTAHAVGETAAQDDDIYADNSPALKWVDSYLQWDVGITAKK